jgi:hypothetical protein
MSRGGLGAAEARDGWGSGGRATGLYAGEGGKVPGKARARKSARERLGGRSLACEADYIPGAGSAGASSSIRVSELFFFGIFPKR